MRHSQSLIGDTDMSIQELFKGSAMDPELVKRNKEKLEAAKEYLEEKWLFHPNHKVERKSETDLSVSQSLAQN